MEWHVNMDSDRRKLMVETDENTVLEALKVVQDPDLGRDIVSLGFVKEVKLS